MYKIALRDGSPVNAGRMIEVDGSANFAQLGELVCVIEGGAQTVDGRFCPDAIVSEAYGKKEMGYPEKVVVMLLTEDMILEAPVVGSDINIAALSPGKFIAFANTGVLADEAASQYCQIVDTQSAQKSGDKILVRFLHNNVKS